MHSLLGEDHMSGEEQREVTSFTNMALHRLEAGTTLDENMNELGIEGVDQALYQRATVENFL